MAKEPMLPLLVVGEPAAGVRETDDLLLASPAVSSPQIELGDDAPNMLKAAPAIVALPNRSTSREVWPLALAVGIGLAVGFAAGYGTASRDPVAQVLANGSAAPVPAAQVVVPPPAAPLAVAERETAAPETAVGTASTELPPAAEARTKLPKPGPEVRSPKPVAAGRILIRTTPAGAAVTIDGQAVGSTPVAKGELAPGAHVVRIARNGFVSEQRRVVITSARPSQSLTIELARERRGDAAPPTLSTYSTLGHFTGRLLVDSRPSGANVFIDNRLVGTTPLMLGAVEAGEHAVRLERDGYGRWTSSVRVVSGEQNKVTASLER